MSEALNDFLNRLVEGVTDIQCANRGSGMLPTLNRFSADTPVLRAIESMNDEKSSSFGLRVRHSLLSILLFPRLHNLLIMQEL
jgi:hypothetical protein